MKLLFLICAMLAMSTVQAMPTNEGMMPTNPPCMACATAEMPETVVASVEDVELSIVTGENTQHAESSNTTLITANDGPIEVGWL